ncbi:uncharacterized protein [Antedon mediterranea]
MMNTDTIPTSASMEHVTVIHSTETTPYDSINRTKKVSVFSTETSRTTFAMESTQFLETSQSDVQSTILTSKAIIMSTSQAVVLPLTTSSISVSDKSIYILVGAACTGALALIFFIILTIFICKRCRKNEYSKASTEPEYDDEKGDISGARWVFNDSRQDWLYDGANDEEDNQYVGPLAGKIGKRSSLMDKRYKHDGETFGRTSPSGNRKRAPLVINETTDTSESLYNKEETKTDEIMLTESNNVKNGKHNDKRDVIAEDITNADIAETHIDDELNVTTDNDPIV